MIRPWISKLKDAVSALAGKERPEMVWLRELRQALNDLTGQVISEVRVQEMALYGPDGAGQFTDPQLAFVQANVLELRTESGRCFHVSCAQTDFDWELWPRAVTDEGRLSAESGDGWFRTRAMPEFPRGLVTEIRLEPADGIEIQRIDLLVAGQQVTLLAGEVYENTDGSLTVHDNDESVLIFLDSEACARTVFNQPVYRPTVACIAAG